MTADIKRAEVLLTHLTIEQIETETPPPPQNLELPRRAINDLSTLMDRPNQGIVQTIRRIQHGVTKTIEKKGQCSQGGLFDGIRGSAVGCLLEGIVTEQMLRQQLKDGLVFIPACKFIEVMQALHPGSQIYTDPFGTTQLKYPSGCPIFTPDGAKVDKDGRLAKLVEATVKPTGKYISGKHHHLGRLQDQFGPLFEGVECQLVTTADRTALDCAENDQIRETVRGAKRLGFKAQRLYNFVDRHILPTPV